jgi:4a-hydroxytetrahydrobiopterin dehydratase
MATSGLASKDCVPCKGGVAAMKGAAIQPLLGQLDGWSVVDEHHLSKTFKFPDFVSALAFVNRVGQLAEQQQHHPDVHLAWGKATITIWTHKINGLTESDFVFAAKCDALPRE